MMKNRGRSFADNLTYLANRIRRDALVSIHAARSGHPGGALSCADLLAYLWGRELHFVPGDPRAEKRDRFVLSKGHACPALYAALAALDLLPREILWRLRKLGSPCQGHPDAQVLPWVEASTGSLGQGFSVAMGMALALRYRGNPARVHVMLGDGELQEGEVWEAAMCAGHHRLRNLCAVIDYNKMQSDDLNHNIMRLEPLGEKWRAFNWRVIEIDGHDFCQIESAYLTARLVEDAPTVIIAHTLKGKGVSFMEGPLWHGSVELTAEELTRSLEDLGATEEEILEYFGNTAGEPCGSRSAPAGR